MNLVIVLDDGCEQHARRSGLIESLRGICTVLTYSEDVTGYIRDEDSQIIGEWHLRT